MAYQPKVYQTRVDEEKPGREAVLHHVLALLSEGLDAEHNPLARALGLLLNEAMRLEREQFLGATEYERTQERRGYANGYKPKTLHTRLGALPVQVPQVRSCDGQSLEFYPSALEKGVRSERALKLALAEMYIQGVSTRKVTRILEEMCGLEVSSTQVSRAAKLLDEELESWRNRPLGEVVYLLLDARYEKVRVGGRVVSCAVLIAVGVTADGRRSVLGVSVSLSEAEVHWRQFLEELRQRGMYGVQMVTSDSHSGLKAALQAALPGVAWQRCQFHLQQNAQAQVSRQSRRREVAEALRGVFNSSTPEEGCTRLSQVVERYATSEPKLAAWLEENVPEALTVLALPPAHRRVLRTTNGLERLNKEIKRRTRVATLFPNETALLRLVSAVVIEISEEWECGRIYLSVCPDTLSTPTPH